MARKNLGDCIKNETFSFTSLDGVRKLPVNKVASRALVEFYTDSAGAGGLGSSMSYTPLVVISEDGTDPVASYAGVGFKLFNMSIYELTSAENIENFKVIAFGADYTVYCQIQWYK